MIIDQLFENNKKPLNEVDPRNFDSDEDYYAAVNAPTKRRSAPSDYPYSREEDDAYFNEIFRKKREAAKKAAQDKGSLTEFAEKPENGPGSDEYEDLLFHLAWEIWSEAGDSAQAERKLSLLGWKPEFGDDYTAMVLYKIGSKDHRQYTIDEFEEYGGSGDEQGVMEGEQLDELNWKDIQRGAKKISKGAQKFTKNVADTGAAIGGAARDVGGAIKQVGKTAIADPVSATYNATKSGLNKAANVAANTYNDVKAGAQKVGQAGATVGTDLGNAAKSVGRGVANVAGGTAGGLGAVAGGATTGLGRAAAHGFNAGVQNVGGDAVDRMQTNIMVRKPTEIEKDIQATQTQLKNLNAELEKASAPQYKKVGSLTGATNLSTGEPYTGDELDALRAAQSAASVIKASPRDAANAITKNAAGSMMSPTTSIPTATATPAPGQPNKVSYGQGFSKPTAPKPTSVPNYGQKTPGYNYTTSVTPTATPQLSKDEYIKRIGADAAQPVNETIKQVKRMMETVTSKADVQRIKDYIDYHMGPNLSESAQLKRNRLLSEVTQLAAVRRREIASRLA